MKYLAKTLGKKTRWLFKKIKYRSPIVGYVESLKGVVVSGWVLSHKGAEINLSLRTGKETFSLKPIWIERPDIAKQYGQHQLETGFQCFIPRRVVESIEYNIRKGKKVSIFANNVSLKILNSSFQPAIAIEKESLGLNLRSCDNDTGNGVQQQSLTGQIESWGGFMITGWLQTTDGICADLDLYCDGVKINPIKLFRDRNNIQKKRYRGAWWFEIELPGYIWDNVGEKEEVEITLFSNDVEVSEAPILIGKRKVINWMSNISVMGEGKEKQYLSLLAIEHMRWSGFYKDLPCSAQQYFLEFSRKVNLFDYMTKRTGELAEQISDEYKENEDTLLLWESLSNLNKKLIDSQRGVFECVVSTQKEMGLKGGVKASYHRSVLPLLCRNDRFHEMKKIVDTSVFYKLGNKKNNWLKSLAIAPLVVDGHVDDATDIMLHIAKDIYNGWFNTECIGYSIRQLQALELAGDVDRMDAERFRYSLITVLDSFKGEWFSRLHDQELIDAMIVILCGLDFYTDYHRKHIVDAAIRLYGLNPKFWLRLDESVYRCNNVDVTVAQSHWRNVYRSLNEKSIVLSRGQDGLLNSLQYFDEKHNLEVPIFLREITANILSTEDTDEAASQEFVSGLLDLNSSEELRVMAYPPLKEKQSLLSQCSQGEAGIYHTLREMTERPHGSMSQTQIDISLLLKSLKELTNADDSKFSDLVGELTLKATALNNSKDCFLGVDVLAQAYVLLSHISGDLDPLITILGNVFKKVANSSEANFYLFPPVCAAVYRLSQIENDPRLFPLLQDLKSDVDDNHDEVHDDIFSKSGEKQLMVSSVGWPQDTLVVIYSCKKYMETRVGAIRETWIKDLSARGIPYVILTGDGDDQLNGDLLSLDVSDSYEDLPKKTLKMLEWVFENTDAAYILKIDDDCYLDVAEYFDTLGYRKFDYYGRTLNRSVGAMDRKWHHDKSQSEKARKTIDKSPEPSVYADGGGGYCLSRLAIKLLMSVVKTEEGRQLIASSFMEDKLIGDLLSLVNIVPSNEDYECYQRRRTYGEAIPVAMRENIFYPSVLTPTKVVHLDTHLHQQFVSEIRRTDELWPKKIWPTCWSPSVRENSNQLELLSDISKAKKILKSDVFVVSVVRNEMAMLPHFLSHYRGIGVTGFIVVDNCSDDGTREYLYEQPDVVLYSSDTEYKHSHFGVAWQQAILGNHCLNKWVLSVDADELLVYEDIEEKSLSDFTRDADKKGVNAIRTDMVDMYPYGDLNDADFMNGEPFKTARWFDKKPFIPWMIGSGQYSNSTTYLSGLRHRLVQPSEPNAYTSQKYALVKYMPWVRYSQGLHDVTNVVTGDIKAWLAHFKYHSGFKEKVLTEIKREQHYNNAAEYRRYMDILAEGQGGFGSKVVSSEYESSHSFTEISS